MTAPIVVRGQPTDAELAALAAVLLALRGAAPGADVRPAGIDGWTSRRRQLRIAHRPGPGAWRASVRP